MIKAVLFDYGGVLTTSGKRGFITSAIAELYGISRHDVDIDAMRRALYRGQADGDTLFAALNREHNKHVTQEDFLQQVKQSFVPCKEVYELAAELRAQGLQTGILSNVFTASALVLREHGWYDEFAPVVLSCEEGFAKPELQIYKRALHRLDCRPEEVLFIDDFESYLLPARVLGMETIHAMSPHQIVADVWQLIARHNAAVRLV